VHWSLAVSDAEVAAWPEGSVTFRASATDAAGNTASSSRTVLKDTQVAAPVLGP
jgi:hypothetical protein